MSRSLSIPLSSSENVFSFFSGGWLSSSLGSVALMKFFIEAGTSSSTYRFDFLLSGRKITSGTFKSGTGSNGTSG